ILNWRLFGGLLSTGYSDAPSSVSSSPFVSLLQKIAFFAMPSGFHADKMLLNSERYLLFFAPLIFGLALISFFAHKQVQHRAYMILFSLITAWILIYYGSGTFWGGDGFTMDASYIRYFLPIYVLVTPLAAW